MSEDEIDRWRHAQKVARDMAVEILDHLRVGMTESDGYNVAREVFRKNAIRRHWHMPVVGFGVGTSQLRSLVAMASGRLLKSRRLRENDLVLVDIAPIVEGYSSDYSATRVYGTNPELERARTFAIRLSQDAAAYIRPAMKVCDVHAWIRDRVSHADRGYRLLSPPLIHAGHRIGRLPSHWPHVPELTTLAYLKLRVRNAFLTSTNQSSMVGSWTVEPYIGVGDRAVRHEELILVTSSQTLRLGPPEQTQ